MAKTPKGYKKTKFLVPPPKGSFVPTPARFTKVKGSGWHGESRRHSLASKGIKTAQKVPRMPKLKNWSKGSDLTWYYKGTDNKWGLEKVYVDHFVPSKGWRYVIVRKYDIYESYFPTKEQAIKGAMDYMEGVNG